VALTVEDGTGLAAADSYISIADALTYHAAMGNTAWAAATEAAQEIALRRAAQYIDTRYKYRGERKNLNQSLEWPRVDYEPDGRTEAWPVANLKAACCEAALRALSDTLTADVSTDQVIEETVGPITVRYASKSGQTRYPVVDDLLRKYVVAGAGHIRVERTS
jgi:hypothetical protein